MGHIGRSYKRYILQITFQAAAYLRGGLLVTADIGDLAADWHKVEVATQVLQYGQFHFD
jgi:hypothetical protein